MPLIFGLLFYVNAHVALVDSVSRGAVEVKTFTSVECRSNVDIKVQFSRTSVSNTYQTIAECETLVGVCYLIEQSYGIYYAIFHTSNGAIFSVANGIEETRGTYYCCETYNPGNCVDLKILQLITNTSTHNSNPDIFNNIDSKANSSDEAEVRTLIICIVVLICVVLIPATLANILIRRRSTGNDKSFRSPHSSSRNMPTHIEEGSPMLELKTQTTQ